MAKSVLLACTHACAYVYMYVYMYVWMGTHVHVHVAASDCAWEEAKGVILARTHTCMYLCICVRACEYVFVCMHVCMHVVNHAPLPRTNCCVYIYVLYVYAHLSLHKFMCGLSRQKYSRIQKHTRKHTYDTYAHAYICIRTHTNTLQKQHT